MEFFVLFDRLNLTQRRSLYSPPIPVQSPPLSKLQGHFFSPLLANFPLASPIYLARFILAHLECILVNSKSLHVDFKHDISLI